MPDWRRQGQEKVKDRKEGSSTKLDDGITCIRSMPDKADILPDGRYHPKDGGHAPYREYRLHRHWGPDDATVRCGKDIDGKGRCWGCDVAIPKLESDPRKAAQVREVGPQEQFVINASKFDINTKKFKLAKIMYLSTGAGIPGKPGANTLALRVYSKIVGTQKDYIDPVKGYNLNIEKTGSGLKTRYPSIEGDEHPTKVPTAVLLAVQSLDTLLPKYDEEDMKSLWFGRPRRDRDERGGGRSNDNDNDDDGVVDEAQDAEYAEDAPLEDGEYVDPDADAEADAFVDPDAEPEYAADAEDADPDADPEDVVYDAEAEDVDPDPDAPEEYGDIDPEDIEPEPPPASRRSTPPAGRQPARTAAPPQRAPARQPAPARRAPPPPPAPAATKRAAPAATKRAAPRGR